MRVAIDKNLAAIDDGLAVLGQLADRVLDSTTEAAVTAGPHFRHCIDFYDCFLAGLPAKRIDYDARSRSTEVEGSPENAASELARIRAALNDLPTEELDAVVEVQADTLPAESPSIRSTVNRELLFLLSHTIHHWALVALLMREAGVDVPADFGFAPSTLEHASHDD